MALKHEAHAGMGAPLKLLPTKCIIGFGRSDLLVTMKLCAFPATHRITLTYNLHQVNNTAGGAAPTSPVVDIVHQTAFGRSIQEGLKSKGWHAKGATLGFALEHQYTTGKQ